MRKSEILQKILILTLIFTLLRRFSKLSNMYNMGNVDGTSLMASGKYGLLRYSVSNDSLYYISSLEVMFNVMFRVDIYSVFRVLTKLTKFNSEYERSRPI